MDRKKTILIAVMINAGLLAVLFVASLTLQDEEAPLGIAEAPFESIDKPLFPDSADTALKQSGGNAPALIQIPLSEPIKPLDLPAAPAPSEEPVLHRLPPLIPEAPQAVAPAPIAPSESASVFEVKVKKGDTLDKIAKAHKTTVDEIIKFNHLPSSFLRVGQTLKLPALKAAKTPLAASLPEKKSADGPDYYTVKVGDNPWTIAMKHHIKVDELLKLNQLNEEKARKLKPGDRLRVR